MTITRAAVAAASLVLLASCGGSGDFVDTPAVVKDVKETIKGPGKVKVEIVDCPDDQTAEVGNTFTCTYGLADGSSGEILVTVQTEDGGFTWERSRRATGEAQEVIRVGYEKETGKKVKKVTCPDPLESNKRIFCDLELKNGTKGRALVTVVGDKIRWATN